MGPSPETAPTSGQRDPRRDDVLRAIDHELERTAKFIEVPVRERKQRHDVWTLAVDAEKAEGGDLDESLEGSSAWWKGGSEADNGAADVLAIEPDVDEVHLRHATHAPPGSGQRVRIYPPRFLAALRVAYADDGWSASALAVLDELGSPNPAARIDGAVPDPAAFPWLRVAQRAAFSLLRSRFGFVWGPPGTGKTRALGALVAKVLVEDPAARIAIFSTTNVAIDRALLAADAALTELAGAPVPDTCTRIGQHFVASLYVGREHLLPKRDDAGLAMLIGLEARRPERTDILAYARWRAEGDLVRAGLRVSTFKVLEKSRLVAATATRALVELDVFRSFPPFDLIVFDEASQVSLAHALALLPLGRRAIFAGDPRQLSPIVRSAHASVDRWLGRSPFAAMDERRGNVVFLDEQSRMAPDISRVVSQAFYDGRLKVAADARSDANWWRDRALPADGEGSLAVDVQRVDAEATWSRRHRGPLRPESARCVVEFCARARAAQPGLDVLVLTPFRAQRRLLKEALRRAGITDVAVSTVHAGQGDERHTVIFDPVDGSSPWLKSQDARRLINVAVSRAKARLVLTLSAGDLGNPWLSAIVSLL